MRVAGLPARQGVLIVYPHTSNRDFPVAMLAQWAIGLRAAWRSGFYHLAVQAGVPLALVYLDDREREIGVRHFLKLTRDVPTDMARISAAQRTGRNAGQAAPIRLES